MKISYSQVEKYCNELHFIAKGMKNLLEYVEIENKTLECIWEGEAATSYSFKLKKVIQNFDQVFNEVENSILFMANCSEGYQAIDQTVLKEICENLSLTEPNLSTSEIFD